MVVGSIPVAVSICSSKIAMSEANKKQSNILDVISNFNGKIRLRSKTDKEKKSKCYRSVNVLYQGQELTLKTS